RRSCCPESADGRTQPRVRCALAPAGRRRDDAAEARQRRQSCGAQACDGVRRIPTGIRDPRASGRDLPPLPGLDRPTAERSAAVIGPAPCTSTGVALLSCRSKRVDTMAEGPLDLPQGTLDLLILKTLALEPRHGWAIAERLHQISSATLSIRQGTLYPA